MSAFRILASPRVWLPIVGVAAVLGLICFAYLAAVASPEKNLEDLPIALVNEDAGWTLAGEKINLGDQIVERVTSPDSPAADTVGWGRPESRAAALRAIGNDEYYGAIVIPKDYSERISVLIAPPAIRIAVVNEDEGARMNGQPVAFGGEVTKRITAPDSPAPSFVEWVRTNDRTAALDGLGSGGLHAAIVIPKDYSQTLMSLSGPPPGTPTGAPAGRPRTPEPAEVGLLTSPAVRPSTTALIEDAFAGIVGGVSGATSERILGSLSEQGVPVPQGAAAVISDPVRGEISEADVPAHAGPLPEVPKPAEIEILTNPSAGQAAATPAENISTGIVRAVSWATSERVSGRAGERGAQLTPEVAAVVGNPVRAEITEAQPIGPDSANGQTPFFLAFLANLSGLVGGAAVFFGVGAAARAREGLRPSRAGLWTARLLVMLVYAALVAAAELLVAFGVVGVEHEAGAGQVYVFLAVAIAASSSITMLFAEAFGTAGIGISAVLNVILGLVSSGGLAPLEALPPFYQAYADWLPLRYVIDGLRSLLFYDGTLAAAGLEDGWRDSLRFLGEDGRSEAAGLEDAVWVLGAYLAGAVALGYGISLVRDVLARRKKPRAKPAGGPAVAGR